MRKFIFDSHFPYRFSILKRRKTLICQNSDHGGTKSYLVELDINDPYKIKETNHYKKIIEKIISFQERCAYPKSNCPETQCPWYTNCERVKWHWVADYPNHPVTKQIRFNAYCKLKKSFMTAYYMAVLEKQGVAV